MGNKIGGSRRKAKVMKINGESFKVKTPIRAWDVVKDYPSHVLLDSQQVKRFGVRAKQLEPQQELKPKKTYFLVELPKFNSDKDNNNNNKVPRRVQSGIQMSAKDRLECLMLSRRSASDLTMMGSTSVTASSPAAAAAGTVRMKVRLPRAQVAKLVEESKDDVEVAEKIMELYLASSAAGRDKPETEESEGFKLQWKPGLGSIKESFKAREESDFCPCKRRGHPFRSDPSIAVNLSKI